MVIPVQLLVAHSHKFGDFHPGVENYHKASYLIDT